jgi:hypothetical protein
MYDHFSLLDFVRGLGLVELAGLALAGLGLGGAWAWAWGLVTNQMVLSRNEECTNTARSSR